ncbi:MAG: HDOD domain-containing protein [Nautiliaceae bacterium]
MLISEEKIKEYLKQVPPIPQNALLTLKYLKEGNLKEAAKEAEKDLILKKQIEGVVNSAYFSIPKKVENTVQLFTMIGLEMATNLVYSYIVSLLEPKEWKIFNINFKDFQAEFLKSYEESMIFEFGEVKYKKYPEIGAIIPVAVCVCDMLLGEKKDKLELILNSAPMEIATLLKRLTGMSLFEIASKIAKIWELEDEKCDIIKNSECLECKNEISALVHFLFFYLSSKPAFFDLNSLIEFNTDSLEYLPKTKQRIINA